MSVMGDEHLVEECLLRVERVRQKKSLGDELDDVQICLCDNEWKAPRTTPTVLIYNANQISMPPMNPLVVIFRI